MADVATLSVLLIARDKLSGALKKNQAALRATGQAATAMGALLVGSAALSVKAAVDFESSFAGVRKTVDATEAQFAELASGFRNLAKEIPVNVNELNRIGEAAGQLGIKRENIIAFTETIAKLGVTTNLTGQQAATQLARIANITGLSQKEFDRMGSTIVELGNNLATTEAEIVTFTLRIAGAGKIAGLTETDMLAIGGAMTSVGVQAEAGGTAVQKVLLGMNQAVVESGAELEVFAKTAGLSAVQFAKAFRDDAGKAFTLFVEGLGKAGDDAINVLGQLDLTDQRLIRSFLSLSNAGGLLRDSMKLSSDAFEANTALTKEAEERFKTFASQLTIAKNQVVDIAITVGQILIPILQSIIEKVGPIVEKISTWASENEKLTSILVIGAAAVGGLLLVLGPLLIMLPGIAAAVGLVSAASLPLTIIPLAIAAAVAALIVVFVKWESMSKKIQITILAVMGVLTGGLLPAIFLIAKNWKSIWEGMKKVTETVVNKIIDAINVVMRKVGDFIAGTNKLLDALNPFGGNPFGNGMNEAADSLQNVLGRISLTTDATQFMTQGMDVAGDAAERLATQQINAANEVAEITAAAVSNRIASERTWDEQTQAIADLNRRARIEIGQKLLDELSQRSEDRKAIATREADAIIAAEQRAADARAQIFRSSTDQLIAELTRGNTFRQASIANQGALSAQAQVGLAQRIGANIGAGVSTGPTDQQIIDQAAGIIASGGLGNVSVGSSFLDRLGGIAAPNLNNPPVSVVIDKITLEIDGDRLETKIVETVVKTQQGGGFQDVIENEG